MFVIHFLSKGYSVLILWSASSLKYIQPLTLIRTSQVLRSCFCMSYVSWVVNLITSVVLNIPLPQYIQDGDHSWCRLFTDFWHANEKLRSREAMVLDRLRELHFQTPCNTPGFLHSHGRLTDLPSSSLHISAPFCSVSSSENVYREGVHVIAVGCPWPAYTLRPSPSIWGGFFATVWDRIVGCMVWHSTAILMSGEFVCLTWNKAKPSQFRWEHQSPSKRLLRRAVSWGILDRESVGHLGRMLRRGREGREQSTEEDKRDDHATPSSSPPPALFCKLLRQNQISYLCF